MMCIGPNEDGAELYRKYLEGLPCPSCAALRARVEVLEEEARQVCGELGEFYGKGQGTAVEKIRFLYRDWEQRDEVWREKKRVLENDLAKEWAKIERMENDYVELHKKVARFERVACDLEIVGRIMHESWTRTKRAQGYHHPSECYAMDRYESNGPCPKCHSDLIPWEQLPEVQKDINRHAFDDVLAWLKEGV